MESKHSNEWCRVLEIEVPRLPALRLHRDAVPFSLFLMALLERGKPMTLAQVAARFEEAQISPYADALLALQRCRPGRPPVYKVGDLYHLDPHSDELSLWIFRLGLRPPKGVQRPPPVPFEPLPDSQPLTFAELDEAWRGGSLNSSAQRIALAVLDAQGGPMAPVDVVARVSARAKWHRLEVNAYGFGRKGSGIEITSDGKWSVAKNLPELLAGARREVRSAIAAKRSSKWRGNDLETIEANIEAAQRRRDENAGALANLRRALLVAFPETSPQIAVAVDVNKRTLVTFAAANLAALQAHLADYDVIGAINIRKLLQTLNIDPGSRRLADLSSPQKTIAINKQGRTLKITTAMLVTGSCGISQPFGDETKTAGYLAKGDHAKLRKRMEANAKSLFSYYTYSRLHGSVRLRWGFLDCVFAAPWVQRDEHSLYTLMQAAEESNLPLEVVVGTAPGWQEPWARAQIVRVIKQEGGYHRSLIDDAGNVLDEASVQLARFGNTGLGVQ